MCSAVCMRSELLARMRWKEFVACRDGGGRGGGRGSGVGGLCPRRGGSLFGLVLENMPHHGGGEGRGCGGRSLWSAGMGLGGEGKKGGRTVAG